MHLGGQIKPWVRSTIKYTSFLSNCLDTSLWVEFWHLRGQINPWVRSKCQKIHYLLLSSGQFGKSTVDKGIGLLLVTSLSQPRTDPPDPPASHRASPVGSRCCQVSRLKNLAVFFSIIVSFKMISCIWCQIGKPDSSSMIISFKMISCIWEGRSSLGWGQSENILVSYPIVPIHHCELSSCIWGGRSILRWDLP